MDLHEQGRQHVIDRMADVGGTLSPNAQVRSGWVDKGDQVGSNLRMHTVALEPSIDRLI